MNRSFTPDHPPGAAPRGGRRLNRMSTDRLKCAIHLVLSLAVTAAIGGTGAGLLWAGEPGPAPTTGRLLPAARAELAYPNYRGLILPDVDRVEVILTLDKGTQPGQLTCAVSLGGVSESASAERNLRQKETRVSLPTKKLPAGPLTLRVSVSRRKGGAELHHQEWSLRKLTTGEAGQLKAYVDPHNNTVVDGKPFFPLGWYGSPNEQHLAELADSPFNCLLAYGTDKVPKPQMLHFLDLMEKDGLKLIYCLNDVYPTATYFAGQTWEGVAGNDAIAAAVVAAYREHPAILAWYLNDELPRALVPKLTDYYHRVRDADPQHPCLIVLCNRDDLPFFPATTDIVGVDPYPLPKHPVTEVSDFAEAADAAVRGRQPVWLVPQAFAWYQYNSTNTDRGHLPTAEELKTGRAPSFEEERCMTYLALAHGAKGLIYYCYYDLRVLPQYREMWAWMKKIAAEVKALSPVLLAPDDATPLTVGSGGTPIHTRLKRFQDKLYLIAVNPAKQPRRVGFDLHRRLPKTVTVLFEGRAVSGAATTFHDTFAPLAAHVYELDWTPPSAGMPAARAGTAAR